MAVSLFTDSYRPTFTRSVVVEGDFRSLVTGEACDLWRANQLVEDLDPVMVARSVSLRIEYLLDEGSPLCFDWELRLEDETGRQVARVEAAEEIVARPDDKKAAYDVGGPTVRGSVNGRVRSFAALWNELRRFLPASITQQLAGINVLGPWVAESLARTWAWGIRCPGRGPCSRMGASRRGNQNRWGWVGLPVPAELGRFPERPHHRGGPTRDRGRGPRPCPAITTTALRAPCPAVRRHHRPVRGVLHSRRRGRGHGPGGVPPRPHHRCGG